MKRTIMILLLAVMASGVMAQPRGRFYRDGFHSRPAVIIRGGYYHRPYYPGFGLYYNYPMYSYYGVPTPPSRLDIKVAGIKNDYADKISSVKLDNSLTRREKREKIRSFKRERDMDILEAKRNYYKS